MERALTVRQPWAWAIVHGKKTVENRSWTTPHRGRIWIHAASSSAPPEQLAWFARICSRLNMLPPSNLVTSAIIGYVDLVDILPVEKVRDNPWACQFGFAWILENAVSIVPIPCNGKLSLWDCSDIISDQKSNEDDHIVQTSFF